jgi:hypothetical protein
VRPADGVSLPLKKDHRHGPHAGRILKGAKPAELPIVARMIGLTIPRQVDAL